MATMISLRRNYTPGGVKMWNRGLMPEYVAYRNRVDADGGDIDSGSLTRKLLKFYKSEGRLSNIKLLWSAVGGTLVQSGTNPVQISKAYSADSLTTHNDLTQATSLNQPYGVGQIQNLPMGLYNPNGGSGYMTHPAISFAANQAWSVSINLNNNGSNNILAGIIGKGSDTQSIVSIRDNSTSRIKFTNNSGSSATGTQSLNKIAGKNATITLTATGSGVLAFYLNGVFVENLSIATDFVFSNVVKVFSTNSREFFGNIKSYCIQSGSLTASQVAAEHAILRSIYPEIPSVVIGSQTWAVDNFRAVATPMGIVIANVTEAAAVEKITNAADREFSSDTGFWTKSDATITIAGGVCHYSATGDGKVLNRSAILSAGKWYKVTYTIKNYSSGILRHIVGGVPGILRNSNGTYTEYIYSVGTDIKWYSASSNTTLDLDDVSIKEVGWSNATEIYDAVYTATSGTTAQKEYAALKEAAMWRSYNNDPANDAIYGKIYNGYAKNLLYADMVTASFGWNIATKTQLQSIAAFGGDVLRVAGTGYWTTDRGNNSAQFYALGGAMRNADGTFSTLKNSATFWAGDATEAMTIQHDSDTVTVAATDLKAGHSIRLTKL